MPRQTRVQYSGAMYHVMNRGDQREDIFLDDVAGRLNLGKPKGAKSNLHKWMNGPPDGRGTLMDCTATNAQRF